jgi:hypothetical protein
VCPLAHAAVELRERLGVPDDAALEVEQRPDRPEGAAHIGPGALILDEGVLRRLEAVAGGVAVDLAPGVEPVLDGVVVALDGVAPARRRRARSSSPICLRSLALLAK